MDEEIFIVFVKILEERNGCVWFCIKKLGKYMGSIIILLEGCVILVN